MDIEENTSISLCILELNLEKQLILFDYQKLHSIGYDIGYNIITQKYSAIFSDKPIAENIAFVYCGYVPYKVLATFKKQKQRTIFSRKKKM
uniref:Uncharacterized protein n=1 Tax=Faxonius propinquus nudivirus TaxID=3139431 RepID=A0AAU8GBN4_9VIRU